MSTSKCGIDDLVPKLGYLSMKTVHRVLVIFVITTCNFQCALAYFNLRSVFSNFNNNVKQSKDDIEVKKLAKLDTVEFVKYYGYPCETHKVTTEDKYILTMHRIPYGKTQNLLDDVEELVNNVSKPVVFLQHGMFSYSGDWFIPGPKKSLGFILADAGFDVWLGNSRGNKHSRDHQNLDPDFNPEFWDFSWHEVGNYDLPAMIDYILMNTEQEKLFYIGHSQGTTAFYVMMSERPEYNDKIIAQYSLAPVAFLNNLMGPMLKMAGYLEKLFEYGFEILHIQELKHNNLVYKYLFHSVCSTTFTLDVCLTELFSFAGSNPKQFNTTLLPIILANIPAGAAVKQLKHYSQVSRSGNFQKYNYGVIKNLYLYGDTHPPKYKLDNVIAPVYLICSGNDYLSSLKDVKHLYWNLPDGNKHIWKVEDDMWNHFDYIWGIQAKELVYDKIIANMRTYIDRLLIKIE